jgi:hypothetical protein
MARIAFNANEYVRVQLTDLGREIHRKHWEPFCNAQLPYSPPKEDEEGWSRFQLWELMQLFGPHTYLGARNSFSLTIQFDVPDSAVQPLSERQWP